MTNRFTTKYSRT